MTDRHGEGQAGPGVSPYDTPLSSATRFGVELIAWIAGPWAAVVLSDRWWAALPTLLVLVALPGVFSTPGDKKNVVVATPGPVRFVIELGLMAAAVVGAWIAWPWWAGVLATVVVVLALFSGARRARWLLAGAPPLGLSSDAAESV